MVGMGGPQRQEVGVRPLLRRLEDAQRVVLGLHAFRECAPAVPDGEAWSAHLPGSSWKACQPFFVSGTSQQPLVSTIRGRYI